MSDWVWVSCHCSQRMTRLPLEKCVLYACRPPTRPKVAARAVLVLCPRFASICCNLPGVSLPTFACVLPLHGLEVIGRQGVGCYGFRLMVGPSMPPWVLHTAHCSGEPSPVFRILRNRIERPLIKASTTQTHILKCQMLLFPDLFELCYKRIKISIFKSQAWLLNLRQNSKCSPYPRGLSYLMDNLWPQNRIIKSSATLPALILFPNAGFIKCLMRKACPSLTRPGTARNILWKSRLPVLTMGCSVCKKTKSGENSWEPFAEPSSKFRKHGWKLKFGKGSSLMTLCPLCLGLWASSGNDSTVVWAQGVTSQRWDTCWGWFVYFFVLFLLLWTMLF